MADKKRLRLMDEQGNVIVYDIEAGSITFDDRNMTLPQVIAMLEAAIEVAGQVKTVTMNGTKIEPDEETGDINLGTVLTEHQDISGKAEKSELAVTNGASADKKVIQLKNGLTLEVIVAHQDISGKADKDNTYTKSEVDAAVGAVTPSIDPVTGKWKIGQTLTDTPAQGPQGAPGADGQDGQDGAPGTDGQDGQDGADGKSAYQSYYDTTSDNPKMTETEWVQAILRSAYRSYLATTSDNPVMTEAEWVASLQGPKGDTVVLDTEGLPLFEIINNLTAGGGGDALSAEMGKRLRQEMESLYTSLYTLYSKLANMAFWTAQDKADAEPTPLNFNVPKVTVNITNNIGVGAVIKNYGNIVGSRFQIDKGDSLSLTIEPANDYEFGNDIEATVDGDTATLTEYSGVYTLEIAAVNANTAIVISGTADLLGTTAAKSDMVLGRSINAAGYDVQAVNVVLYPKGEWAASVNGEKDPGSSASYYINTNGAESITLQWAELESPRVWRACLAYYSSTGLAGFISRDASYHDGIGQEVITLPSGTNYVKIMFGIKQGNDTIIGTVESNNKTVFENLSDGFLKYHLNMPSS